MKSIIWQLCAQQDIPIELRNLFRQRQPESPSSLDLRATLKAILKRFGGEPESTINLQKAEKPSQTFLIFDGLDEMPYGYHRESFFGLIIDISSISTSEHLHIVVTSSGVGHVHIAFTRTSI
jgi:hypothetical protein